MINTTRTSCITQKIVTEFGSHYVHLEIERGCVVGISISSPGKFGQTQIAGMLGAISEAASSMMAEMGRRT